MKNIVIEGKKLNVTVGDIENLANDWIDYDKTIEQLQTSFNYLTSQGYIDYLSNLYYEEGYTEKELNCIRVLVVQSFMNKRLDLYIKYNMEVEKNNC